MLYQYGARHLFLLPLFIGRQVRERNMSTTTVETQPTTRNPAPLPHLSARTTTLVLMAFAAVYVVWGSTYLAIRIGIESFPPLILAGLRHITVGLFLYPILRRKTGIKPTAPQWRTALVPGAPPLFLGRGGGSWGVPTWPLVIAG